MRHHNITYVETELDDIWMRDIGANLVLDDDGAGRGGLQLQRLGRQAAAPLRRQAGRARGQAGRRHTSAASWWAKVAASKWTATAPGS
jgi:hypothetical protein